MSDEASITISEMNSYLDEQSEQVEQYAKMYNETDVYAHMRNVQTILEEYDFRIGHVSCIAHILTASTYIPSIGMFVSHYCDLPDLNSAFIPERSMQRAKRFEDSLPDSVFIDIAQISDPAYNKLVVLLHEVNAGRFYALCIRMISRAIVQGYVMSLKSLSQRAQLRINKSLVSSIRGRHIGKSLVKELKQSDITSKFDKSELDSEGSHIDQVRTIIHKVVS